MKTPLPETLTTNKTKMIGKLVQGQEITTQLLNHLKNPSNEGEFAVLAEELLVKILDSFTESISELNSKSSEFNHHDLGTSCDEGSSESRKRPAVKDRRGCYKRRKDAQTWTTITSTQEDGHGWRKYGQKEILNSKYPRAYFRCTRRLDQDCKAIKQVQKMEDNPQLYQTTYIGVHTCKDVPKAPQIISADSGPWKSYLVFSGYSESKRPKEKQIQFSSCSDTHAVKEEESREESPAKSEVTDNNNIYSMDSMFWPADPMSFDSSDPTLMSPNVGSVYTCTDVSSQSLDMDDIVGSVDLDSILHFD